MNGEVLARKIPDRRGARGGGGERQPGAHRLAGGDDIGGEADWPQSPTNARCGRSLPEPGRQWAKGHTDVAQH